LISILKLAELLWDADKRNVYKFQDVGHHRQSIYISQAAIAMQIIETELDKMRGLLKEKELAYTRGIEEAMALVKDNDKVADKIRSIVPKADDWRSVSELPNDKRLVIAVTAEGKRTLWQANLLTTSLQMKIPSDIMSPVTHWQFAPEPPVRR
jgi:hypothetical protein